MAETPENVRLQGSGVPGLCGFPNGSLGILYTGEAPERGSRRSSLISCFIFSDCAEPLLGGLSHRTVATSVKLKGLQFYQNCYSHLIETAQKRLGAVRKNEA